MAGKPGQQGHKPRAIPGKYVGGWLESVDRRYKPAIIAQEKLEELATALGGDLSPQQQMLVERSVWLNLRLQQMEQEFLAGVGLDSKEYTALTTTLVAVLARLGIRRVAKPIPSALEYAERMTKDSAQ